MIIQDVLLIDKHDTVAVALKPLSAGNPISIDNRELVIAEHIPQGHKIALRFHAIGDSVVKYGSPIGTATEEIQIGSWVHSHNLKTSLATTKAVLKRSTAAMPEKREPDKHILFDAFERDNGSIGIRNELWIIPTVGCINKAVASLARWGEGEVSEGAWKGIDGVYAWEHPYGCSQLGDDLRHTQAILADLVHHPNAVGVLVVGLGCENNTIASFKQQLGPYDSERVQFLLCQEADDEIAQGKALLARLALRGAACTRVPVEIGRLVVGLKCGGSDGLSGITANPLLGTFSDFLTAAGGTAILTEIPEMFGAEQPMLDRCYDPQVSRKFTDAIDDFKSYFISHGQQVYENPSPGNKDGGITTLEEKSLGCVRKGGTSPIVDVIPYGSRIRKPGLVILEGPGNDMVSSTALAAAGAHIVLFTTGRGTPLGSAVPTIKVSSNSELAGRKTGWIDFDAGKGLKSDPLVVFNEFKEFVLAVASGAVKAKHEINGYREIAIFKDGVTL